MHKVSSKNNHHAWLGAAWKVAAFACYAGLDGIARYLSGGSESQLNPLPVYEIVFYQDVIAFLILLPWYFKDLGTLRLNHLPTHLLRGIFSGVAVITWYFALFYLPVADAVAISVIGPVMGVLIANYVLKEKLNLMRILIISTSFIVALVTMETFDVIRHSQSSRLGVIFVFLSAFCFAAAKITTRLLAKKGHSAQVLTLSLLLFIIPISLIPALSHWVPVQLEHVLWLSLAGLLTVFAIFSVSKALVFAEVTFLAPFDLFRFLFSSIVGYFAFTELPTLWALLMMVAALVFVAWNVKRSESI